MRPTVGISNRVQRVPWTDGFDSILGKLCICLFKVAFDLSSKAESYFRIFRIL